MPYARGHQCKVANLFDADLQTLAGVRSDRGARDAVFQIRCTSIRAPVNRLGSHNGRNRNQRFRKSAPLRAPKVFL